MNTNEYINKGGTSDWNTLCKWIESKGYDSRYYAISLKKIQNEIN